MKKDTEELILTEIIKIKTEVLKTNSEIGCIKDDIKLIHQTLKEHDERFDTLETKMEKGFAEVHAHIERIDYMFDESGARYLDHEQRILALEGGAR